MNKKKSAKYPFPVRNRFSFRKLSIGLVSVSLGFNIVTDIVAAQEDSIESTSSIEYVPDTEESIIFDTNIDKDKQEESDHKKFSTETSVEASAIEAIELKGAEESEKELEVNQKSSQNKDKSINQDELEVAIESSDNPAPVLNTKESSNELQNQDVWRSEPTAELEKQESFDVSSIEEYNPTENPLITNENNERNNHFSALGKEILASKDPRATLQSHLSDVYSSEDGERFYKRREFSNIEALKKAHRRYINRGNNIHRRVLEFKSPNEIVEEYFSNKAA